MNIIATVCWVLLLLLRIAHNLIDTELQAPWWQHCIVYGMYIVMLIAIWR